MSVILVNQTHGKIKLNDINASLSGTIGSTCEITLRDARRSKDLEKYLENDKIRYQINSLTYEEKRSK